MENILTQNVMTVLWQRASDEVKLHPCSTSEADLAF